MTETATHEGGCQCGVIRYRIAGRIDSVAHCHCGMCRRSSGSLVVTWITVSRNCFVYTMDQPAIRRSSAHAERHFCPRCGAQIAFRSDREPESIDITLGTLDHPEAHPADRHVWASDRLSWLRLDEHLPDFPEDTPRDDRH